jgi:enoyl-CoA hydratase/carnithine racemase
VVGIDDLPATLTVLVVAGALGLTTRWVFRPSRPRTGAPVDASDAAELGLLTVIVTAIPRQEAMTRRVRLGDAGIRSSMSRRHDGRMDVLVFRADLDRARAVLGP